ncbi:MAG: MGMT family protein, partial [Bacteroidales bacterium]|nr:MGMT family protein [Bacteroidales bacterium]
CMLVRAAIQRQKDITPYWRVLKRGGELNKEYPGGIYLQRERLEEEGFEIVEKRYSSRYFVKDYKKYLAEL